MTPEGFVRQRILDIGTGAGTRVRMLKLQQGETLPAVRVQRIGSVREQHMRGPSGLNVTRVQVDTFATTYTAAEDVAAEIRGDGLGPTATGVWGWKGEMGSPAIRVLNVELDADGTPEFTADEFNQARIRQDYLVHWKDA